MGTTCATYWKSKKKMIDGQLDVEKSEHGYRWTFVTTSGAMYLGGTWHRTKKAAVADGEAWSRKQ
jgi:hypothetical protein